MSHCDDRILDNTACVMFHCVILYDINSDETIHVTVSCLTVMTLCVTVHVSL